jgi:hypothetical protein
MPAERVPMRCVREILRLTDGCGATDRMIARSTGLARSTVGDYLDRAAAAGLGWPLPPTLSDAALEALLFTRGAATPGKLVKPSAPHCREGGTDWQICRCPPAAAPERA